MTDSSSKRPRNLGPSDVRESNGVKLQRTDADSKPRIRDEWQRFSVNTTSAQPSTRKFIRDDSLLPSSKSHPPENQQKEQPRKQQHPLDKNSKPASEQQRYIKKHSYHKPSSDRDMPPPHSTHASDSKYSQSRSYPQSRGSARDRDRSTRSSRPRYERDMHDTHDGDPRSSVFERISMHDGDYDAEDQYFTETIYSPEPNTMGHADYQEYEDPTATEHHSEYLELRNLLPASQEPTSLGLSIPPTRSSLPLTHGLGDDIRMSDLRDAQALRAHALALIGATSTQPSLPSTRHLSTLGPESNSHSEEIERLHETIRTLRRELHREVELGDAARDRVKTLETEILSLKDRSVEKVLSLGSEVKSLEPAKKLLNLLSAEGLIFSKKATALRYPLPSPEPTLQVGMVEPNPRVNKVTAWLPPVEVPKPELVERFVLERGPKRGFMSWYYMTAEGEVYGRISPESMAKWYISGSLPTDILVLPSETKPDPEPKVVHRPPSRWFAPIIMFMF